MLMKVFKHSKIPYGNLVLWLNIWTRTRLSTIPFAIWVKEIKHELSLKVKEETVFLKAASDWKEVQRYSEVWLIFYFLLWLSIVFPPFSANPRNPKWPQNTEAAALWCSTLWCFWNTCFNRKFLLPHI